MLDNYSTVFHHGEIKDHFVLKNSKTGDIVLYRDDKNIAYPVIFFDPAKAEEFRKDNPALLTSIVCHVTGITFYDHGAVELVK